jgi:hypothetical protein
MTAEEGAGELEKSFLISRFPNLPLSRSFFCGPQSYEAKYPYYRRRPGYC